MSLYVVLVVVCASEAAVFGWVWIGPVGRRLSAEARRRFRWGSLVGMGAALIGFLHLITHTAR